MSSKEAASLSFLLFPSKPFQLSLVLMDLESKSLERSSEKGRSLKKKGDRKQARKIDE